MAEKTTLTLHVPDLEDMAQADVWIRLPQLPDFLSNLSGKVMHMRRAVNLVNRACALLELKDEDIEAARNERTMAKGPQAAKAHHWERANTLFIQAENRQKYAISYLCAVAEAKVLGAF